MNDRLSIGILGSRGIPNRYGGFEAFAEEVGKRLAEKGHRVSVYTIHDHPVRDENWMGMRRILVKNPEKSLGTFGQFIYDLRCNIDSRRQGFDIILHLGYTSDSVWYRLWAPKTVHLVNMDGLEWKRSKYSPPVRKFLKYAERLATVRSHTLIADSPVIREYLESKYKNPVHYLSYGAEIPSEYPEDVPGRYQLSAGNYDLLIARMEPENHIKEAILAKLTSGNMVPLAIVGNKNKFSGKLESEFGNHPLIRFLGPVYEKEVVESLRHYCRLYVHGHSVGGTNPSLLEAMAAGCLITAHDNPFNRAVLQGHAMFFSTADDLAKIFRNLNVAAFVPWIEENKKKIIGHYNWNTIADDYEKLFFDALKDT